MKSRSCLIVILIALILIAGFSPSINSITNIAVDDENSSSTLHFLEGDIDLNFPTLDFPRYIEPGKDKVKIPIGVNYFVHGFGSRFILPFIRQKTVPIKLSLDAKSFCNVEIFPSTVYLPINTTKSYEPQIALLTLSLNRSFPAFCATTITITSESQPVKGLFGLINIIDKASNTLKIQPVAGYYADADFLCSNLIMTPPNAQTDIPINIINNGNARIEVLLEVIEIPNNWEYKTDCSQLFVETEVLGFNNTEKMILSVKPPNDFINDVATIKMLFKYRPADHEEWDFNESMIKIICYYPEDFLHTYNDPFGDVMFADGTVSIETDERPNVDIKQLTAIEDKDNDGIIVCLKVYGEIEKRFRYKRNIADSVQYTIAVSTSGGTYRIVYLDYKCNIVYPDNSIELTEDYMINDDEFWVYLDLLNGDGEYLDMMAQACDSKVYDNGDGIYYFDEIPNPFPFLAN